MILKIFLKKSNIIITSILFVILLFTDFHLENVADISITCLSIIFAFCLSFVLSIYSQQLLNEYMKKRNMLDNFIIDNKKFLLELISSIILIFLFNIFEFNLNFYILSISSLDVISVITIYELLKTREFVSHYFTVYKNTYSPKLKERVKMSSSGAGNE